MQPVIIQIKTVADLRAAKDVESELRKQIIAAKAAGAQYGHLEKQISAVRTAIGNKGVVGRAGSELLSFAEKIPVIGSVIRGLNDAVGPVSAGLVGLSAAVGVLIAGFRGLKGVSDFAGRMNDLGAQTGQSVRDVVLLDQAFRNAGLGTEAVGQSINLLQKALSGVNEEGQPTAGVFERLGLSIDSLKNMSAVDALGAISAKIADLKTPADQTRAAFELFGRSGGRMLALLKDSEAFSKAKTMVGGLAESIGESVEDLDNFSDTMSSLDTKQLQFFAGFAKGLSGDLSSAADAIDKLDLSQFGTDLGNVTSGLVSVAEELKNAADGVGEFVDKIPGGGIAKWMFGNFTGQNGSGWLGDQLSVFGKIGEDKAQTARMKKFAEKTKQELADRAQGEAPKTQAQIAAEKEQNDRQASMDKSAVVLREGSEARRKKAKDDALKAAAGEGDVGAAGQLVKNQEFEIFKLRKKRESGYEIDPKDINAAEDELTARKELLAATTEKAKKTKEENAAKQAALELETAINEAEAKGDVAAQKRLKWKQDYIALWEKAKSAGMDDTAAGALADRGAVAGQKPDDKPTKPPVDVIGEAMEVAKAARGAMPMSSMARLGMAVGENSSAAPVLNKLGEMISAEREAQKKREEMLRKLTEIKDKKAGYGA